MRSVEELVLEEKIKCTFEVHSKNGRKGLRKCLSTGMDIDIFFGKRFNAPQLEQLKWGFEQGVDLTWFAKPWFNAEQMEVIRTGLMKGIDVSTIAKPRYTADEMFDKLLLLENGVTEFRPIKHIRLNANEVYAVYIQEVAA